MRAIVGTVLAAVVLSACARHHDETAERERDERVMMRKLLENAELGAVDAGLATAPSNARDN
jgi:hypothetical protein